jgi:hypothetical protein
MSSTYQEVRDEDVLRNIRMRIQNISFIQDANVKIQLYKAYETSSNYEGDDQEYFVELVHINRQAVLRGLLFMPNGMLFLDWESMAYLTRYVIQGYINSTNSMLINRMMYDPPVDPRNDLDFSFVNSWYDEFFNTDLEK